MTKLPYNVSIYINTHFREGFLTRTYSVRDQYGHKDYIVDISQNDLIYHLIFNEQGKLINETVDPAYDEDYFEGSFYGEDESPYG